ncbi:ATP-dependent RNA helicase A [Tupaia chinensis]|uniref:ATP-dependent RNA helicase A n=1 Tax=Tupaia chinensis TaxID=246437 RepID=L8YER9_TUPCH|nr:ATP-dependent RNA helicase A [Tupaia chinensis]
MKHFILPPEEKKNKVKTDDGEDDDTNCNLLCGDEYGPEMRISMDQSNEKETPFELVEVVLKYIEMAMLQSLLHSPLGISSTHAYVPGIL